MQNDEKNLHPWLDVETSRFLTDVLTASSLLSEGRKCKALSERIMIGQSVLRKRLCKMEDSFYIRIPSLDISGDPIPKEHIKNSQPAAQNRDSNHWIDKPNREGYWIMETMAVDGVKIRKEILWDLPREYIYDNGKEIQFDHIKRNSSHLKFQFLKGENWLTKPDQQPKGQQPESSNEDENLDFLVWLAMSGKVLDASATERPSDDPHLYIASDGWFWILENSKVPYQWQPTVNWAQLGPLIDRFQVTLRTVTRPKVTTEKVWIAKVERDDLFDGKFFEGENAMIAACRAIAATYKPEVTE